MNILFVLVPVSVLLLGVGIAAFFWAVRNGQFDDLRTPGWQVLVDDAAESPPGACADPAQSEASAKQ